MNNEIKRLLRSLDEACTEQSISLDDAVAWFKTLQKPQPIQLSKENTFRDIAEDLVNASCLDNPKGKRICVEILCMAHEAGENVLITDDILGELLASHLIPSKVFGRDFVKGIIYDFLRDYYKKQGLDPRRVIGKQNWRSICYALKDFVNTLI